MPGETAETPKKIEAYGIWDEAFNDFVMLPGVDGYAHATMPDLKVLMFCLGDTKANVVKITVEPVTGLIVQP
jgi:hypothetical protein